MISARTTDPKFLATLEAWFKHHGEILVLIRYSHSFVTKGFEFFSSFATLAERLRELPPLTTVIAFKQPQLPFRGVVDDQFIARCVEGIPDESEYLVVETIRRTHGRHSWYLDYAGISRAELRDDLEESRGTPVAAGIYPAWHDESEDVISAVVPGSTKTSNP
jgi:hypothetical protein